MIEPTHQAILEAIASLRAEMVERWRTSDRRFDSVDARLSVIPVMQAELKRNTELTEHYAEERAFRAGLKKRWTTAGALAAASAGVIGLWVAIKSLLSGGGPHP